MTFNTSNYEYVSINEFTGELEEAINLKMIFYEEALNKYIHGYKHENLINDEKLHLSKNECALLLRLERFHSSFKVNKGDKQLFEEEFALFVEDLLRNELHERNIAHYDYFFIQAFLQATNDTLRWSSIECERLKSHIAQLSITLAEKYSSFSTSFQDIMLLKDSQYEKLEEIFQSKNDFLYSLSELSKLTSKDAYIEGMLEELKSQYLKMSAAEDGFKNLFEYLGYLMYIGNDHFLYEMGMNELENDIISKFRDLTLPDIAFLLECDFESFIDDSDLEFQGWDHLARAVFSSDEFDDLVRETMRKFLLSVPEYFPD